MVTPAPPRESVQPADTEPAEPTLGPGAVLPGLGLLLLLAVLAYAAFPSVRDQIDLSVSKQETPFVELFAVTLDDASHVGTTCGPGKTDGTTGIVFALRSHYDATETFSYELAVDRTGSDDRTDEPFGAPVAGQAEVGSGDTVTQALDVPVPGKGPFDVAVRLPATGQDLLLHCEGTP